MARKISVIVPAFNAECFIGKCIDSILNQTWHDIQVIIVDDGSSDRTAEICETYFSCGNVEYYRIPNSGVSAARNYGLSKAVGEYIGFADADDYLEPQMYTEMLKLINQYDADVVACKAFIGKNDKLKIETFERNEAISNLFKVNSYNGFVWNKLFKSDIIKKLHIEFDINIGMCEDTLFCFNYFQHIRKCVYINRLLYHYVVIQTSAFNQKSNRKHLGFIQVFDRILHDSCRYPDLDVSSIKSSYYLIAMKLCIRALKNHDDESMKMYRKMHIAVNCHRSTFLKSREIPIKHKIAAIVFMSFPVRMEDK